MKKQYWGVEEAKDDIGKEVSCKDGSDLYRPIVVKAEETGGQPSQPDNNEQSGDKAEEPSTPQVWKTEPVEEKDLNRKGEAKAKYKKDSSTGLWIILESNPFKVPSVTDEDFEKGPNLWSGNSLERKKEWANFYSSDDYVKDETTKLWMAPITDEACKGFVCKVRHYYCSMNDKD